MTVKYSTIIKEASSSGGGFNFSYSLIDSSECDDFGTYTSYSIYASIKDTNETYCDERLVSEVTSCYDTAEYIFDMISKGTVTPLTLCEVLEDLLSEI